MVMVWHRYGLRSEPVSTLLHEQVTVTVTLLPIWNATKFHGRDGWFEYHEVHHVHVSRARSTISPPLFTPLDVLYWVGVAYRN